MNPPLDLWCRAFLATQLIEVPIVVGWLRDRLPVPQSVTLAVLASALTHPALWYLMPRLQPEWLNLAVGEALVWLAEAAWYRHWLARAGVPDAGRRAFGVACLANGSSMLTGLVLWG